MKLQNEFNLDKLPPELRRECGPRMENILLRLLFIGMENLKPEEVIEYLLSYLDFRGDLPVIARRILQAAGNDFARVFRMNREEWLRIEGVDIRTAEWFCELSRLMHALEAAFDAQPCPLNYAAAFDYIRSVGSHIENHSNMLICLDEEGCIIYQRQMDRHRNWDTPDNLMMVIEESIASHAAGVILVHFSKEILHLPSEREKKSMQRLITVLNKANVALLDVVFAEKSSISSLRKMNLIPCQPDKKRISRISKIYMGLPLPEEEAAFKPHKLAENEQEYLYEESLYNEFI